MIEVVVNDGPDWIDYIAGLSTAGATIFAGWAALSARSAAAQTRRLVDVEKARDARAEREAEWRQARRMLVELAYEEIVFEDGRTAYDFHLSVHNTGHDPVFKARIKAVIGDQTWGPQLIGAIPPGHKVGLIARIFAQDANHTDNNGYVRFTDTEGRAWIVAARGSAVRTNEPVDTWIDDGRAFGSQPRTREERGQTYGVEQILDLDAWRHAMTEETADGTS